MSVLTSFVKNGVTAFDGKVKLPKVTERLVEIVEPTLAWMEEEEESTAWGRGSNKAGKPCPNNFRSTAERTEQTFSGVTKHDSR